MRLARRRDTSKRAYLLVNPLQAKHVPSRPGEALAMMEALGRALAAEYPDTGLVVGFAETATAIGAVTAGFFPAGCVYLTTTRERLPEVRDWVLFREEHSHAAQQKLCGDGLRERLRHTKQLIFVEDELSTGRTMGNVVRQLRETYPEMADMPVIAASLLNRMSEENIQQLRELGVTCRWLVRIPQEDYTPRVLQYTPMEPVDCRGSAAEEPESLYLGCALPNPRLGVPVAQYQRCCGALVGAARRCAADSGAMCWCWGRRSVCIPPCCWPRLLRRAAALHPWRSTPPPAAPSPSARTADIRLQMVMK